MSTFRFSQDSNATAQCEFCLRRYLCSAMMNILFTCELRMVRCPLACGAKVLVRNLDSHRATCLQKKQGERSLNTNSMAEHAAMNAMQCRVENQAPLAKKDSDGSSVLSSAGYAWQGGVKAGSPSTNGRGGDERDQQGGSNRSVTCMRCQQTMPLHNVPMHGPVCPGTSRHPQVNGGKGNQHTESDTLSRAMPPQTCPPGAVNFRSPPREASAGEAKLSRGGSDSRTSPCANFNTSKSKINAESNVLVPTAKSPINNTPQQGTTKLQLDTEKPTLTSSSDSPMTWQQANARSACPGIGVEDDPFGHSIDNVKRWTVRDVTSWLRECLRPPKAEVIEVFYRNMINGTALLEMTERQE
ncbi:unnamed protein product [Choristocarpus tenellus]